MKKINNLVKHRTHLVALLMLLLSSCAQEEKTEVQPVNPRMTKA